eukprot:UN13416
MAKNTHDRNKTNFLKLKIKFLVANDHEGKMWLFSQKPLVVHRWILLPQSQSNFFERNVDTCDKGN